MTTEPKKFYFNNSSVPLLACSRQYKYTVIDGAVPSPNKIRAFKIGLTFHHFMKLIGTPGHDLITLMGNDKLWHPDSAGLDRSFILQLAVAADRMHTEHPELFADCIRERFFEVPAITDDKDLIQPIDCGTGDLLSYVSADRTVYITDYKTTSEPIDGSLVNKYNLSSQRFFYEMKYVDMAADPNNNTLPPHYKDAINNQRLKFGYWFYSHKTDADFLCPHTYTNFKRLAEFRALFDEKRELASYLHLNPDQTAKEGVVLNLCRYCAYTSICGLHDEKLEAEQFAKWPYGFKPYYPKHE